MLLLFASAAFLGAYLLFCVQPMIARMMLPQFGGSPAVWNTCLVFFQVALLAGYVYAHAVGRWLGDRRQVMLHLGVLALPIVALPIVMPGSEASGGDPALRLLGRLMVAAGLPFFVVATTAPLLQRWFAATGHRRAGDPYFLYAASNAGSLLALVGYVTLIEPGLTLGDQARLWAAGYAALAGLMIACGIVHRRGPAARPEGGERIDARRRWTWVALAFVPSSLLLGVTTYLTTDLSPVPLLWVVPLGLYLISFIVAFADPPAWVRRGCAVALAPAIVATLALMARPSAVPLWATFLVHLATFSLAATACHVELARSRPSAGRLTEFYLMMSIGGALGGIFNALIAPVVFTWVAEYPLGLALAASLVPAAGGRAVSRGRAGILLDVALPLLLGGASYAVLRLWGPGFRASLLLVPLAMCLLFIARPLRFALGLATVAAVIADVRDAGRNVVLRERGFFGVLRVSANFPDGMNTLAHGNTLHGMQRRIPDRSVRRVPLMYYFPTGPIGQVFEAYNRTPVVGRVGVVGLGVGSLAGYGMTGQEFTFFEVDPAVERIARDPAFFHYLEDCRARWRVVLGDARMTLAREPDAAFGLIVLDAFSGDAIPVHLLTREALRIYLAKLADGGLIALHISNNYLDLGPAVRELARDAGLAALDQHETSIPPNELGQGRMPSHWVILARRRSDLDRLASRPGWRPLPDGDRRASLWTDDHCDLFGLLRWR
ncbi:MAG TPA: fused MFS/spermidine synthase [Isosphaeraceae bacterium]|jgi:hypothetical protein